MAEVVTSRVIPAPRPAKKSLKRNVFANLAGSGSQIAVTLVALPFYIHAIGPARYGMLTLVLVIIGYFGLFDLGLGRALTNLLPRIPDPVERAVAFRTALLANAALALVAALIFTLAVPTLLLRLVGAPPEIAGEAARALPIFGIGVAVALLSSCVGAAIAGREEFAALNLWQSIGAILTQLLPLGVAYAFGPSLVGLVAALVVARLVVTLPLWRVAARVVPLDRSLEIRPAYVRTLLTYGGWVTVSNIVSPILVLFDRFVIGALGGAASVAAYSVPFAISSKLLILPSAISQAAFPRFSAIGSTETKELADRAVRLLGVVLAPVSIVGMLAMRPFLHFYVGPSLAAASAPVGEVMLLGIWINCMTYVPFSALQGQGRPRLTAIFHLVQLPPYVVAVWFAVQRFGIVGAAWAWTFRLLADAGMLFGALRSLRADTIRMLVQAVALQCAALLLVLYDPSHDALRIGGSLVALALTAAFVRANAPAELSALVARYTDRIRASDRSAPKPAGGTMPSKRVYFPHVEGLRGVAALYVFLFHLSQNALVRLSPVAGSGWQNVVLAIFQYGHYSVTAFIVISGYCLGSPVARMSKPFEPMSFAKRRFRRLYPAYVLALALSLPGFYFAAIEQFGKVPSKAHVLVGIVAHLFMVHNLSVQTIEYINGPLWSIALEVQIYVAFALLLVPIWRKFGSLAQLGAALVLSLAPHFLLHGKLDWTCPWLLALFAMGVWAADQSVRGPSARIPWKTATIVLALVGAPLALTHPGYALTSPLNKAWIVPDLVVGAVVALFFVASSVPGKQWLPARLLSLGPVEKLGMFSYSLYLIHGAVIALVWATLKFTHAGPTVWLVTWAVTIPAVILIGYGMYLVAERPFLSSALLAATEHDREKKSDRDEHSESPAVPVASPI